MKGVEQEDGHVCSPECSDEVEDLEVDHANFRRRMKE
jgi:hypothetical protein